MIKVVSAFILKNDWLKYYLVLDIPILYIRYVDFNEYFSFYILETFIFQLSQIFVTEQMAETERNLNGRTVICCRKNL